MNLADRIKIYLDRGLQEDEAAILVLIEEAGIAIFTAFPDHFVLFGGAALLLFHQSPRFSRDLDLLASTTEFPPFEEFVSAVRKQIQPMAEILGLGQLDFRRYNESNDFIRCWVVANEKPLFSIDLTTIGGSVLESQIVKQIIAGTSDRTVRTVTANCLLLQKCEVFLTRRHVKARDAFDIHLLLGRGASLNNNLQAHLEDFVLLKELDAEFIEARIRSIDVKLSTIDLRPILPPPLFHELAKKQFELIRDSLRKVFSEWVEEN
jgi:nucleotidyltransferase AbiEii toxin of type IV toxin-antitoxin system